MQIRHKMAILLLAFIAVLTWVTVDFVFVSGKELPGAENMTDTAEATIEIRDRTGTQLLETRTLTRGQSAALQSLLLRTGYQRTFSESAQVGTDELTYDIYIVLPGSGETIRFAVLGHRLLAAPDFFGGWLQIRDKDWGTAFEGILAAD